MTVRNWYCNTYVRLRATCLFLNIHSNANTVRTVLCYGELWLAMLATLHAENTPSFSSFFARGKARTCAFFWLARCCWLSPGLTGSLFPDPEPAVVVVLEPADPADWAWRSRGCKACAAGSDISTLLQSLPQLTFSSYAAFKFCRQSRIC